MVNDLNYCTFLSLLLLVCILRKNRDENVRKRKKPYNQEFCFVYSDRDIIFDFKQLIMQNDPNISELYIVPNEYKVRAIQNVHNYGIGVNHYDIRVQRPRKPWKKIFFPFYSILTKSQERLKFGPILRVFLTISF